LSSFAAGGGPAFAFVVAVACSLQNPTEIVILSEVTSSFTASDEVEGPAVVFAVAVAVACSLSTNPKISSS
jgi:hypothetical protein